MKIIIVSILLITMTLSYAVSTMANTEASETEKPKFGNPLPDMSGNWILETTAFSNSNGKVVTYNEGPFEGEFELVKIELPHLKCNAKNNCEAMSSGYKYIGKSYSHTVYMIGDSLGLDEPTKRQITVSWDEAKNPNFVIMSIQEYSKVSGNLTINQTYTFRRNENIN